MAMLLLWMFAVYGMTMICIQLGKWLNRPRKINHARYYLLTHNSQTDIEWFIRSLAHWSMLEGKDFQIYIKDSGSVDDTLAIIDRLERKGIRVERIEEELEGMCTAAGSAIGTEVDEENVLSSSRSSRQMADERDEEMVIDLREERRLSCESNSP